MANKAAMSLFISVGGIFADKAPIGTMMGGQDGTGNERRRMAPDGQRMGTDRTTAAATQTAPIGLPQSTVTGSGCHECNSVSAAHRVPMERTRRHRHLLMQFGVPTFSRMDRGRRVRSLLAARTDRVRWTEGNRLVLVVHGRSHDESTAFGLKKTGPNPTDRGKQGVKRSLLTEAAGIPLALAIEGANRHDMKLVRNTLEGIMATRPLPTAAMPHGLCLDKGYDFDEVRSVVREFGFTAHIRARGEEARAIKEEAGFKARRWVVERTHSWMNRFRRILIRWEKLPDTFIAMLHLACGIITWRATGLLK